MSFYVVAQSPRLHRESECFLRDGKIVAGRRSLVSGFPDDGQGVPEDVYYFFT